MTTIKFQTQFYKISPRGFANEASYIKIETAYPEEGAALDAYNLWESPQTWAAFIDSEILEQE